MSLFTLDPRRLYPILDRAEDVYVWDTEGNRYLDAIAGIGVANIGYGRAAVAEAMADQAARLPFAVGNIFANAPALRLASAIARLTPGDLNWVHFTSGGSEAVEVAIKLARQYHVERGQPERDQIISRWTSYHGATLAALAVGGSQLRRLKYLPLLPDWPHIPPAYCYRCPWERTYPSCDVICASELERAIQAAGPERVAAFIAEPIVASVGGAIAPVPEYFPTVRKICDRYGVLFIADEVVTGFGRTGVNFAVELWGVVPDILVMGKGVSGGYAPLGAVAVRDEIHGVFVEKGVPFEHIFTFGGNPISAAAALAVLQIWERERLVENVASLEGKFHEALEELRAFSFVGDIRSIGFMAGIEFVSDRTSREPFPAERRVAALVREAGLRHGIVTYPGTGMADGKRGDIISLYPPLTFSAARIDEMAERLRATFADVEEELLGDGRPTQARAASKVHPA